ncbi:hypothetical protein Tco_0323417 [Tanacetum coccineum]
MANIRTCNKHNMIACVEKTEHNADFHQIVDYLTGCSINYSLLVDPDLIGPWLQQFWATASLRSINEVPHIRAMVAGKGITPLTPPSLEVITALAAKEAPYLVRVLVLGLKFSKGDAQGTAEAQGAADIPQSPNDYTPTDESQTSGGDEGLLDLYALNREVRRLKKQTISQAKQIHKLKAKLKKLSKGVKPLVKHHILWVKSQKLKKRGKKQKKKVSSVKLGRNKDEGNLSEEHHDQDDHNHTAFVYEDFDATDAVTPDLERKSDETEQVKSDETEQVKSDETEQVLIEEEKDTSDVKSGDTEELDLERIQSTARQSAVTPRTLNFDEEVGSFHSNRPTKKKKQEFKDENLLLISPPPLSNISRPRA